MAQKEKPQPDKSKQPATPRKTGNSGDPGTAPKKKGRKAPDKAEPKAPERKTGARRSSGNQYNTETPDLPPADERPRPLCKPSKEEFRKTRDRIEGTLDEYEQGLD